MTATANRRIFKIETVEHDIDTVRVGYSSELTATQFVQGPINPLHLEMTLQRAQHLQVNGTGPDSREPRVRKADIDNLMLVAGHIRDLSHLRKWPFSHQVEDAETAIAHPYFFITSEMRTGKTKIVIDAAQHMFRLGMIDRVLVVAPAPVRNVWFDQTIGEINKHGWRTIPALVTEFHSKTRRWDSGTFSATKFEQLQWMITNFEFLRSKNRVNQLLPFCTHKTLMVIDESSFVKTYDTQQTKAVLQLRRACGRVIMLNGTPISQSPLDLFSQGNILHPSILECKYITEYKSRYAIMEPVLGPGGKPLTGPRGHGIKKIVGWRAEGLLDLQRRFAPCTVRRLQVECLDLPLKLDPITLTATMTPQLWKIYKSMRDDMVVWLKDDHVSVAAQATTKVMRLAQITSGIIGGVAPSYIDDVVTDAVDDIFIGDDERVMVDAPMVPADAGPLTEEIGREKLDVLLWFLAQRLEVDPLLHVVIWSRFRPEMFRALEEIQRTFPQMRTGYIAGQKKSERMEAMQLLHPETSPKDVPVAVVGIVGTGAYGLDFSAAALSINLSYVYSLGKHLQGQDRIYGPMQTKPCAYYNIVAVGPSGQKTIDHAIVAARQNNEDIANWTQAAWIKALSEE
jgi:hypothetical protein